MTFMAAVNSVLSLGDLLCTLIVGLRIGSVSPRYWCCLLFFIYLFWCLCVGARPKTQAIRMLTHMTQQLIIYWWVEMGQPQLRWKSLGQRGQNLFRESTTIAMDTVSIKHIHVLCEIPYLFQEAVPQMMVTKALGLNLSKNCPNKKTINRPLSATFSLSSHI